MMAETGTVERVSCKESRVRKVVFDWKIKDFSKSLGRGGYICKSPEFHFCGHTWYLHLDADYRYGIIDVIIRSKAPHPAADIPYSLGIRSTSGKTEEEVAGILTFSEAKNSLTNVFGTSEVFGRRKELLPLDVLTLTVTLKARIAAEGTRVVPEVEGNRGRKRQRTDDERREKTGTERVLQDIGKMWPSDEQSDVVFKVGDEEFKAHRAILSARTPALGAMFRHDTAEKASGLVTIGDCEPAVFEQLLHYVYKGAPREVTAENAFPLFTVADKYLVSEVKTLCVRVIRGTLCVDTFCNAVTLALIHGEDELLETAVDFFSRNMVGVLETVQWQTFLRDHSTWANEIMIRAVKMREEKRSDAYWSLA